MPNVVLPTPSMPKGGGAVRSIGELVTANLMTGTAALTVPFPLTPGRSGFTPDFAIRYDSGGGNGVLGLGWAFAQPAITRRTDIGVPLYRDAEDSDTYLLGGAEELVPELRNLGAGDWEPVTTGRTVGGTEFRVIAYRPRTDAGFAKIERWCARTTGETHWRTISRNNVTTIYGRDGGSRVEDPTAGTGQRVFSWLITETFDDRGNWIVYEYQQENSDNVELSQPCEHNRSPTSRSAARHLKRIKYGNRVPRESAVGPAAADWMFELVLDYGDHSGPSPGPQPDRTWDCRMDPFSTHRAGFEVRNYRLCKRALMFHHFPDEPDVGRDCLVKSLAFTYLGDPGSGDAAATLLAQTVEEGHRRVGGDFVRSAMPAMQFEYSTAQPDATIHSADLSAGFGHGVDGSTHQWVDLDGDGMPGVLSFDSGSWSYHNNYGGGRLGSGDPIPTRPATVDRGGALLTDLAGDGQLDVVTLADPAPHLYERDGSGGWTSMRPLATTPAVAFHDPLVDLVDLTGNGLTDLLVTENDRWIWYQSRGEMGFGPPQALPLSADEDRGPRRLRGDAGGESFLADMSGDGLADIVRVRNGEVCYWPNLGHGRFGAKITMGGAPPLDPPGLLDHTRVLLVDVDGCGPCDLVHLDGDGAQLYVNQSGNQFGAPRRIQGFPRATTGTSVDAVDLMGNGTGCLVWSSPWPADQDRPVQYLELTGGIKPHLLTAVRNNVGVETELHYAPSTAFYRADREAGHPWVSRLPFPVHVVDRLETRDMVSGNRFVSTYSYHHGHYDGVERQFCGFGRVDQTDSADFGVPDASADPDDANAFSTPPAMTRTWFHTGSGGRSPSHEFWSSGDEPGVSVTEIGLPGGVTTMSGEVLPWTMTADETRQAHRVLRGSVLREEVYGLERQSSARDAGDPGQPYRVSASGFSIVMLQPATRTRRNAVFSLGPRENVEILYERTTSVDQLGRDADPRVTHGVELEVDFWGNVLRGASVAYGRRVSDDTGVLSTDDHARQQTTSIVATEYDFTNAVLASDAHRTPLRCEHRTYEIVRTPAPAGRLYTVDELRAALAHAAAAEQIPAHDVSHTGLTGSGPRRRLLSHARTRYRSDDLTGLLPVGTLHTRAIPGQSYQLAFTPELLSEVFRRDGQPLITPASLADGAMGYVQLPDATGWWIPSSRSYFHPEAGSAASSESAFAPTELGFGRDRFFLPHRVVDPFGAATTVGYDSPHNLNVVQTNDPFGNTTSAGYDYRVQAVNKLTDANGNRTFAVYDCRGALVATAVTGKPTDPQGDSIAAFEQSPALADPSLDEIQSFIADPAGQARALLGAATNRIVYDSRRFHRCGQPVFAAALTRRAHVGGPGDGDVQVTITYFDGFGRTVQAKVGAEAGPAPARTPPAPILLGQPPSASGDFTPGTLLRDSAGALIMARTDRRWVGKGRTVYNNKGMPVLEFEPFFSGTVLFEDDEELTDTGVSPVTFYDPIGRVVATLHADHSYDKIAITPWGQTLSDGNDTVLSDPRTDPDTADLLAGYFARQPADWKTWHQLRVGPGLGDSPEDVAAARAAARQTESHASTPLRVFADPLGRTFLTVADNGQGGLARSRTDHDVLGNELRVTDARGNVAQETRYDLVGRSLRTVSPDAGSHWVLPDAAGAVARTWDGRGASRRMTYDALRRPVAVFVTERGAERCDQRMIYGEEVGPRLNHRGRLHRVLDESGLTTNEAYDFKGNLLRSSKRLVGDPRHSIDWRADARLDDVLDSETFTSMTTYDALDRVVQVVAPHSDGGRVNVVRPVYNSANFVEAVSAWVNHSGVPNALLDPAGATHRVVTNIDYDALGRRVHVEYANGVRTTLGYDRNSLRLSRFRAVRAGSVLQDVSYTYDAVGNVVAIRDPAAGAVVHSGQVVTANREFRYDPMYRLISASGREHRGGDAQVGHDPDPWTVRTLPSDGQALRRYVETYRYDQVGNILAVKHHEGSDHAQPGTVVWHRRYQYALAGNRLLATSVPADPAGLPDHTDSAGYSTRYTYDAHGNTTASAHIRELEFDDSDQLRRTDLGGGGVVHYSYDNTGQRVRKLWDKSGGLVEERIYLGGFELYRRHSAGRLVLERETLPVDDGTGRVALIENRTHLVGDDPAPALMMRVQLTDHLNSVTLELDDFAAVIAYEEYHPFGSTAYCAVRSQVETARRYRHSGKERDEGTGFYYYGARYFAPWTGRWISCDPAGLVDGPNLYVYVRNNPVSAVDREGRESTPSEAEVKSWMDKNPDKLKTLRAMPYSEDGLAKAIVSEAAKDRKALPASTDEGCKPLGGISKQAAPDKHSTYVKPTPDPGPGTVTVRADGVDFILTEQAHDMLTAPAAKAQARDVFNGLGGALAAANATKARNETMSRQPDPKARSAMVSAASPQQTQRPPLPDASTARARELLANGVREQQQHLTTVAIASAIDPMGQRVNIVATTVGDRFDATLLQPGEILVTGEGKAKSTNVHAEVQIMRFANANGYQLIRIFPSREFCGSCALPSQQARVLPPGSIYEDMSPADMANLTKDRTVPRYKTHEPLKK